MNERLKERMNLYVDKRELWDHYRMRNCAK